MYFSNTSSDGKNTPFSNLEIFCPGISNIFPKSFWVILLFFLSFNIYWENLSASNLTSGLIFSSIFFPVIKLSTFVFNSFAISSKYIKSGKDTPRSQLLTAWSDIPISFAILLCEYPSSFLLLIKNLINFSFCITTPNRISYFLWILIISHYIKLTFKNLLFLIFIIS